MCSSMASREVFFQAAVLLAISVPVQALILTTPTGSFAHSKVQLRVGQRCHFTPAVQPRYANQLTRGQHRLSMSLDMDSIRQSLRTGIEVTAAAGSALAVTSIFARSIAGSNDAEKQAVTLEAVSKWFQGLNAEQQQKLFWCLFLDILGGSPELVFPGAVGETLDGIWAPVYAFLLFQTFGARSMVYKSVLAVGGFFEEVLPFVSIVPSATIGFLLEVNADSIGKKLSDTVESKDKK